MWLLALAGGAAVAVLLVVLYRQSAAAQIARDCGLIRGRFDFYTAQWAARRPMWRMRGCGDLADVVGVALTHQAGAC